MAAGVTGLHAHRPHPDIRAPGGHDTILVNVTLALDRTPKEAIDLCRAYGASARTTLVKVQIPTALPALFASLRIAAPLALVGSQLAEWLATGKGLGYAMITAGDQSAYSEVWACVVLVTVYALVLTSPSAHWNKSCSSASAPHRADR